MLVAEFCTVAAAAISFKGPKRFDLQELHSLLPLPARYPQGTSCFFCEAADAKRGMRVRCRNRRTPSGYRYYQPARLPATSDSPRELQDFKLLILSSASVLKQVSCDHLTRIVLSASAAAEMGTVIQVLHCPRSCLFWVWSLAAVVLCVISSHLRLQPAQQAGS